MTAATLLLRWLWHTAWRTYWDGPIARGCSYRPYVRAWIHHKESARDCEHRLGWR